MFPVGLIKHCAFYELGILHLNRLLPNVNKSNILLNNKKILEIYTENDFCH